MLRILESPPIVFNPGNVRPEAPFDMQVDAIGWGDGRVDIDHRASYAIMSREQETALLFRIFLSKEDAADRSGVNFSTLQSRHQAAMRALGVHTVNAAVARMFTPEVDILKVRTPLDPPNKVDDKLIDLFQIAASDGSYEGNCETSHYWARSGFVKALRRNKDRRGEHMTTAMLVLYGFMSRVLSFDGPDTSQYIWTPLTDWAPPARPDKPPVVSATLDGLSITHPSVINADGLYLPYTSHLPRDAALTFKGRSWRNATITGVNLLGGRARINREHVLASHLTETELRYIGASSLGLTDPQCEEMLYLSPEIGEEVRDTLYEKVGRCQEEATMIEIVYSSFQYRLLEIETLAHLDFARILERQPDYPKYVQSVARGGNLDWIPSYHAAYRRRLEEAAEDAKASMHVDNAGLITAGYLIGALKPKYSKGAFMSRGVGVTYPL